MIKVSVMYPNKPGVRFDHDYHRTKHLPLIKSRMGAALKYYTIDKALMDGEGKPLGAYVAMCHHCVTRSTRTRHRSDRMPRKSGETYPTSLTGRRAIRSARWWSGTLP